MTLSAFRATSATKSAPPGARRTFSDGVFSAGCRAFGRAVAVLGEAVILLVAYRAARKRLEARVGGDLFDEPVLWAELKSAAWAEAGAVAGNWRDRLLASAAPDSD